MLVTRTQIQVMLKNHTNKEILRIVNPLMDGISTCTCACTFGMTTKPAKQHKLPLEASDMQFCRGIWLCPCYLACSLDIDVSFFLFLFPFHSVSYTVLLWFMGFLCSGLFWFV
uniref:Uncharacterized protein n=1 Tax=Setaria italica TaxID=4555 RepID=K4APC7_SETIT